MIIGFKPQDDIYIFRTKAGDRFSVKLKWNLITVPSRDGTDGIKQTIFNMKKLVLDGEVFVGTTSDEAFAAIKLLKSWPETDEFDNAIAILRKFLDKKKNERINDYLGKLVDLYGSQRGIALFDAIRERKFRFPAYQTRETTTSNLVKLLLDEYPGVASSTHHTNNFDATIRMVHACGGSKLSARLRKMAEESVAVKQRIDTALQIAKFFETQNCTNAGGFMAPNLSSKVWDSIET